jgi:hypothetical protein
MLTDQVKHELGSDDHTIILDDTRARRVSLRVRVVTTNIATGEQWERTINHCYRDDRVWLGRHCYWAMRSGHRVMTEPK